ncbi:YdeI/OmpD-associated family protein [Mucilaginibacter flavidus]|uniref:YdeI/OmpD-associated family protein n=1 Tax=Mucilaginibacter flavidus TaxID=2949309 RepID=UPI002093F959|nr:YdeI/OmpD-associated family protein [Mucilaginibacter flavidus]MCO5948121.1 YdeI/OmpD-associated family protein [Mucilaginibacter flavidus]
MDAISPVAKKLLIKPGKNWLFYNAPEDYLAVLEPLPEGAAANFSTDGEFDGVQLFVQNSGELIDSLKTIMPILKPDTVFWVTYPKKSSGIPSDLEMMSSWDELDRYGYNGVAAAAINDIWTALRFRPKGQSKVPDSCNEEIKKNDYANYIDVDNKQIKLPDEMQQVLANEPVAMEFYQKLSYSNKKEYVAWILSAKQEKTKNERLVKLVEKLSEGKKNPSEK